jgi:mRNA interferase RelE/StbE
MAYRIEYLKSVQKSIRKIDATTRNRLRKYIERLAACDDPRIAGKCLANNNPEIWRYRIGDYRLLCKIDDGKMVVLMIDFGHRSKIYK